MIFSDWKQFPLRGTSVADGLSLTEEVFTRFEEAAAAFYSRAWITCPQGCGGCCEGFEPDILPWEADYLAAYILLKKPFLAEVLEGAVSDPDRPHCPLYAEADPAEHCPVYPVRPLICRAFGFSSVSGKAGPIFRLCSRMPDRGRRNWTGEEIVEEFGAAAPILDRYGRMLETGLALPRIREALGPAVRRALAKISYYLDVGGSGAA